ncbi:hypothetical protein PCANC_05647 [Puccinia coronata f. sp. avenae]|uniref:Uncharacterized protein n=1 Tax=Puccinia coronata f. sp. avenae TaxID=200324 RepID=A0A2N5VX38_9BASI|nr:hypothetical protein PCANC_05647 [Puccinia coronata f. sp. avenae]
MRLAPSEIIELCHGKIDSLESQMECQWLESQELFLKIEEIRVRIEIPLNAAQDNLYHKLLRDQFIKSEFYNLKLQELREEWIVELMDIVQGPFDEHLEEANEQPFDKHLEELNQQPFDEHLEEVRCIHINFRTGQAPPNEKIKVSCQLWKAQRIKEITNCKIQTNLQICPNI